jgi:hypothetical protein
MIIGKCKSRRGLTLIELMVASLAAVVLILGIGAILVHGHLGYHRLFRRVNSDVVRNAYEARLTFDRIVRKSDSGHAHIIGVSELYVYYYSAPSVPELVALIRPNRYARFYESGGQLLLDRGIVPDGTDMDLLDPTTLGPTSTQTLADDVVSCEFTPVGLGAAIRMILTLDSETDPEPGLTQLETSMTTISTTAIRHNMELQVGP